MKVGDIMTKKVITISPETKINEVSSILTKNRFHGLPVVDKENHVIGIVTRNDFFSKSSVELYLPSYVSFLKDMPTRNQLSGKQKENVEKLLNTRAEDIMTLNYMYFSPETDIQEVFKVFKEKKLNSFPVVDEDKHLLGILTLADIISLL
jgi:CBS domain-containing protein